MTPEKVSKHTFIELQSLKKPAEQTLGAIINRIYCAEDVTISLFSCCLKTCK